MQERSGCDHVCLHVCLVSLGRRKAGAGWEQGPQVTGQTWRCPQCSLALGPVTSQRRLTWLRQQPMLAMVTSAASGPRGHKRQLHCQVASSSRLGGPCQVSGQPCWPRGPAPLQGGREHLSSCALGAAQSQRSQGGREAWRGAAALLCLESGQQKLVLHAEPGPGLEMSSPLQTRPLGAPWGRMPHNWQEGGSRWLGCPVLAGAWDMPGDR